MGDIDLERLEEFSSRPLPSVSTSSPQNTLGEVSEATAQAKISQEGFIVSKVVDGDTIKVKVGGEEKTVRFIGINTPETVDPRRKVECFGKEASNETRRLLEGKEVVLEKDINETDKYGRLLRYIYLKEEGGVIFVNDYLVREGFAYSSSYPPDVKYQERLNQAQEEARLANKGLWGKCRI